MVLPFPKPKDFHRKKPLGVIVMMDGRERCNGMTAEGREEYERRKRQMWERQNRICCLKGHIESCPGRLDWNDCTYDHEIPRGMGSANRDDRIEVEIEQADGTLRTIWQNGAAHARCNSLKGSRRIKYNAPHNDGYKINPSAPPNPQHGMPQRSPDERKEPAVAHALRSGNTRKAKGA